MERTVIREFRLLRLGRNVGPQFQKMFPVEMQYHKSSHIRYLSVTQLAGIFLQAFLIFSKH